MEKLNTLISFIEDYNDTSIIIRIILSAIMGGVLGIEREYKSRSAGFRTFTLVCLGSTVATIANLELFYITGSADVSRIAAGVVSGIGFLGVGTIIVTSKNRVRGLTTAAELWVTGCLGIALGTGMITTSVFAFMLIYITMCLFSHLSYYIASHNRRLTLYIELDRESAVADILEYFKSHSYEIQRLEKNKDKVNKGHITLNIEADLKRQHPHGVLVGELSMIDGVFYIEE